VLKFKRKFRCQRVNKDIDVNYFVNNDNNGRDDFDYCMKHASKSPYPSMNCNHTTKEIKKIIMSLKSKNSNGYDKICTKILKVTSPYINNTQMCQSIT